MVEDKRFGVRENKLSDTPYRNWLDGNLVLFGRRNGVIILTGGSLLEQGVQNQ